MRDVVAEGFAYTLFCSSGGRERQPLDPFSPPQSLKWRRYNQITLQEPKKAFVDVETQIHFLLTLAEASYPVSTFWNLTVGGIPVIGGDGNHKSQILTSMRVKVLSDSMLKLSWEELEQSTKASCDLVPGWHEVLTPEFEKLRDFLADVSKKGNAILRISSARAFQYRLHTCSD